MQLQQSLQVKMLLIQDSTENFGQPKPLRISGVPGNVEVCFYLRYTNMLNIKFFLLQLLRFWVIIISLILLALFNKQITYSCNNYLILMFIFYIFLKYTSQTLNFK